MLRPSMNNPTVLSHSQINSVKGNFCIFIPLCHFRECVYDFLYVMDRMNLPYKFSRGTNSPTLVSELGSKAEAL